MKPKCDCGRPAQYNVQKMWVCSRIKPDKKQFGGLAYTETGLIDNQDPTGNDNQWLCKACYLEQFDAQRNLMTLDGWVSVK